MIAQETLKPRPPLALVKLSSPRHADSTHDIEQHRHRLIKPRIGTLNLPWTDTSWRGIQGLRSLGGREEQREREDTLFDRRSATHLDIHPHNLGWPWRPSGST